MNTEQREQSEAELDAARSLLNLDELTERLQGDLTAECWPVARKGMTRCFEPEVQSLAAIGLALLARLSAVEQDAKNGWKAFADAVQVVDEQKALVFAAEARVEAKEAVRRMDEALAKQYDAIQAYEGKIQDLARETLRNSALKQRVEELEGVLREQEDAWEAETDGWLLMQRHFRLLPDVDLWDSQELLAAIDGRLEAIRERQRSIRAEWTEGNPTPADDARALGVDPADPGAQGLREWLAGPSSVAPSQQEEK